MKNDIATIQGRAKQSCLTWPGVVWGIFTIFGFCLSKYRRKSQFLYCTLYLTINYREENFTFSIPQEQSVKTDLLFLFLQGHIATKLTMNTEM